MKRSLKEILIRLVILFIGLSIAHLGVTLFLLSNLGADPFNVLVQGIFRVLSSIPALSFLTHGYTHMGICFLIMVILLFVDKSYIKFGTIFCMFFGGPIIDFFTIVLQGLVNSESMLAVRVLALFAGCIILAFGMTIVMESDAGVGPNDLVAISISDKLHKPFGITRTICDISFVVIGALLGGVFGMGTIVCAGLVGTIAEKFIPFHKIWVGKVIERTCK